MMSYAIKHTSIKYIALISVLIGVFYLQSEYHWATRGMITAISFIPLVMSIICESDKGDLGEMAFAAKMNHAKYIRFLLNQGVENAAILAQATCLAANNGSELALEILCGFIEKHKIPVRDSLRSDILEELNENRTLYVKNNLTRSVEKYDRMIAYVEERTFRSI